MKNYFKKLNLILKKIDNEYLYNLPLLFKKTNDVEPEKKYNFNFFRKNILIESENKLKSSEIIILSHYTNQKKKQIIENDPYFGDLFNKLKLLKKKFSVIFINHTNKDLQKIHYEFKKNKFSKIFVNNQFSIKDDIFILFKIVIKYISFKIKIVNKSFKKEDIFFIKKNFNLKNFIKARSTIRLNNYLNKVLNYNNSKLKILLITFEGHAFEKLIFKKYYAKNVKTIGYYFSILRKQPNNIFYLNDKRFCPKEIFVSGEILRKYFRINYHDKKVKIKILGSNKNIKLKNFKFNNLVKKKYTCLVTAEGIYSENYILLEFVINNLEFIRDVDFIVRFHPVVDRNKILNFFKGHKNYKKVTFSKNLNIFDDFKKSDFILYRGSSACVEATLNAVIPIYLNDDIENIDPIFQINKLQVNNYKNFNEIIKKFQNKKKVTTNLRYLSNLQSYCKDYYSEFPNKNLKNFF